MEAVMSRWQRIFDRMTRRRRERDLDREIRAHLDLETEESEAGVPPVEASYAAQLSFGSVTLIQ
jgi:hypothetical protein